MRELYDKRVFYVNRRFFAQGDDTSVFTAVEVVDAYAVMSRVHSLQKFGTEFGKLYFGEDTFEDRVLYALPVVEAVSRHGAQAFLACGGVGLNIVGDKNIHGILFEEKDGIGVKVASDTSCHKQCLRVRNEPYGDFLLQKRVSDGLLLALLPGREKRLAAFLRKHYALLTLIKEVARRNLFAIDERKDKAVAKIGSQLFYHVKGKRGSAGA